MSPQAAALRLMLLAAAGLSACGDKPEDSTPTDDSSASTDDSSASTDDSGATSGLTPLPGTYPDCTSPDDTGSDCCVDAYSASPTDGACPAADTVDAQALTGVMLGSGSCQCTPVEGPYGNPAGDDGLCYYTVGIQGCEGRPMVVAGQIRRAALASVGGWSRA